MHPFKNPKQMDIELPVRQLDSLVMFKTVGFCNVLHFRQCRSRCLDRKQFGLQSLKKCSRMLRWRRFK